MTTRPEVTLASVRAGPWNSVFFDARDYWQRNASSTVHRGLVIVDRGPRGRKSTVKPTRQIYYGGQLFETLDAVVAAINREKDEAA